MTKKTILILFIFTLQSHLIACLNAQGFDIFGKKTFYDFPIDFIKEIDIENYRKQTLVREVELKKEYSKKPFDEYYYTELSYVRVFQKKYHEAKALCLQGLKIDSLDYSLISNLAVACELEGKIDSALLLIKKAVKINKNSHFGSEWIHIKILEATINQNKNPNWIYKNTVLGFKISQDSIPKSKFKFDSLIYKQDLFYELEYQLKERLTFVKPSNVIVANLLLTLGDLYLTEIDYRYAEGAYLLAKEYDVKLTNICDKRLAYLRNIIPTINLKLKTDSLKLKTVSDSIKKIKDAEFYKKMYLLNNDIEIERKQKYLIITIFLISILVVLFLVIRKIKSKK